MLSTNLPPRRSIERPVFAGVALAAWAFVTPPAQATDFLGVPPGGTKVVCVRSGGDIYIVNSSDSCDYNDPTQTVEPTGLQTANVTFNDTTNSTTFIGGTVQVNAPITITGPTAINANATFNGTSVTFNADVDFTTTVTTAGIDNSGFISTDAMFAGGIGVGNLSVGTQLTLQSGVSANFGGNVIQGVAAGVAATDAVNVAQLNAATAGVSTDITALETATASHTIQITDLQSTSTTHTTQIAAVEAVNATQSTQITGLQDSVTTQAAQIGAIQSVNMAQSSQIAAVEAVNTTQGAQIGAIQSVNSAQTSQIAAVEAVNSTQSNQISALQAANDLVDGRIDSLFDLRGSDRQDLKQGVASAMAMASAPMPSEPGRVAYAVNGATFRGQYAVGGSLTYRLPTAKPFAVNVGFSYAGNKNNGARVGVAGEF